MNSRLERRNLLGHDVHVVRGILRSHVDYDDAWYVACVRRSETVFDVGANNGYMAMLALLCPTVKKIVLLDPNPEALRIAAENLIRNRMSARARFVCAFVSDRGGQTARLWAAGGGGAASIYAGHAITAARAGESIEVPTVKLDEVSQNYDAVPDLLKIDVEGAEVPVLEGARSLASRLRSRFLVEMHSNPELTITANTSAVLKWSEETGYAAWYLARHTRLTDPEQVADRGRYHLLLQPSDWPYPSWLRGIAQGAPLSDALATPHT